ncbi:MAG: DUF177 domain-containing protein [Candidatus Omnitrophica bacterium]|nr:DUF177 domain-containing protein [Candidatus Omnitrophota bacterium]
MKINTEHIPAEGCILTETVPGGAFDLDTDMIKFSEPVYLEAEVSRICNAVTVEMSLKTVIRFVCSRCLEEFRLDLEKNFRLNYQSDKSHPILELDGDIREEIILDYPINPLCKQDCRGLCVKCGENINRGLCTCR